MAEADCGVRVVLVTAPDEEAAAKLARALVEERLAACVNLLRGVRSIYAWEGRVQDEAEVLLVVKTGANRSAALAARIADLHPYDVPEIVELSPSGGSEAYLGWVKKETAA